jgi:ferredoxin
MRVRVNREVCVGSGQCVLAAELVFDQDAADGVVVLRQPAPAPELHTSVREAASLCPANAILLSD